MGSTDWKLSHLCMVSTWYYVAINYTAILNPIICMLLQRYCHVLIIHWSVLQQRIVVLIFLSVHVRTYLTASAIFPPVLRSLSFGPSYSASPIPVPMLRWWSRFRSFDSLVLFCHYYCVLVLLSRSLSEMDILSYLSRIQLIEKNSLIISCWI